jgi:hypothetical protein
MSMNVIFLLFLLFHLFVMLLYCSGSLKIYMVIMTFLKSHKYDKVTSELNHHKVEEMIPGHIFLLFLIMNKYLPHHLYLE